MKEFIDLYIKNLQTIISGGNLMKKIYVFVLVIVLSISSMSSGAFAAPSVNSVGQYTVLHANGDDSVKKAIINQNDIVVIGSSDSQEYGFQVRTGYIAKLSFNGDILWMSSYNGSFFDIAKNNQGFVIVGYDSAYQRMVLQYDHQGNLLWERVGQGILEQGAWSHVKIDDTGNILLGGYYSHIGGKGESTSNYNMASMALMDSSGTTLWSHNTLENNSDTVDEMIITSNHYLFFVYDETFGTGITTWDIKTITIPIDKNGVVQPTEFLDPTIEHFMIRGSLSINNGQYHLLSGVKYTNNIPSHFIHLFDSNMIYLSTQNISSNISNLITGNINLVQGDSLITDYFNATTIGTSALGQIDSIIITVDSSGQIKNMMPIGGTANDYILEISEINGNLIGVGYTNSPELTGVADGKNDIVIWRSASTNPNPPIIPSKSIYFKDLDSLSDENISAIDALSEKKVIEGKGNGLYDPINPVSRAEFAKILVLGFDLKDDGTSTTFTDVKSTNWFNPFVTVSKQAGMINGYSDNSFKPNQVISKQEIVKICSTYLKSTDTITTANLQLLSTYKDANQMDEWTKEYTAIAIEAGILKPEEEINFNGKNSMTRADAALLVYRTLVFKDSK
ncbi:MAG: hypothetical protein CVU84_11845 [Firmicutes bacterium HGW-Firmicutes-1]|jgi:hypothetical protein|nr:MAG: hypothetical protein CVU84_11845 [Firmicutes bacterium HGW-Firmicutes-1]